MAKLRIKVAVHDEVLQALKELRKTKPIAKMAQPIDDWCKGHAQALAVTYRKSFDDKVWEGNLTLAQKEYRIKLIDQLKVLVWVRKVDGDVSVYFAGIE